jgi:PKD repeat protein
VRHALIVSLYLFTLALSGEAQRRQVIPTTTLQQETGNNTSMPDSFQGLPNGNMKPGNVSKLPIRSLLYPGAQTRIFSHTNSWWGSSGHIAMAYRSDDPAQVKRQVEDMASRGYDGIIHSWYGQGHMTDKFALLVKQEAEARTDFSFIISVEHGAIKFYRCAGCSDTDALIKHLQYAQATYFNSPAYYRIDGKPVVLEFGMEHLSIDWARVRAEIPGILMVFRNVNGFTRPLSDGAFAWTLADAGFGHFDWFHKHVPSHPTKIFFADASKGFDDSIATWTANRKIDQECGMRWLNHFSKLNELYSQKGLALLQVGTWNDYEEGTSQEVGIDNCLEVSATLGGTALNWELVGAGLESTIDHYRLFVSADGENLMELEQLAVGSHTVDVASYNLAPGSYTVYVKAVGKASITNKMSNGVAFDVPNLAPVASLYLDKTSGIAPLTVTADASGSSDVDGNISAATIDFGDGASVNGLTGSHAYTAPGTYTVSLAVTDNLGSQATTSAAVVVTNQLPIVSLTATPTSGVGPLTVTASTSGSWDRDGSVVSSSIDFGDGFVAKATTATHTYTTSGTFAIRATVTDDRGATSATTTTVKVNAGVVIMNPASSTVGTSLRVTARGFSSKPITQMALYVNGSRKATVKSNYLDRWITLSRGTRVIEVRCWNSAGTMYKATKTVTVQ